MNHPPSAFSETDTQAYRHLEACISVIFPGAETTPTISLGGTDARKYDIVSKIFIVLPLFRSLKVNVMPCTTSMNVFPLKTWAGPLLFTPRLFKITGKSQKTQRLFLSCLFYFLKLYKNRLRVLFYSVIIRTGLHN